MTDTPTHPIDKELVAKRFSYSRSTYDREASVQAVSDALAQLVQARTGNYFACFPQAYPVRNFLHTSATS